MDNFARMDVSAYILKECERQHSTNTEGMTNAFAWATLWGKEDFSDPNRAAYILTMVAALVEPGENVLRWTGKFCFPDNLRTSHVGFIGGGKAAPVNEVYSRFKRLMNDAPDAIQAGEIDIWVKTLLEIHPWQDGNGRTASIVRNILFGTMDNPTQLPYYFGNA